LAAGLLVLLSGTGTANLLTNGDFEQPLDVGWTDTVYSQAGTFLYDRSDTFGLGAGYSAKVYKYLASFASLRQAVAVPGADLTLTFDARLAIGGGSSTCWPVAALFVRYLNASGSELGATCYYNHHPDADWADNDTQNLIEVTSLEWNHYQLRIAEELSTNLPGVNAADVAQVMVDLFAYDNGT
jgi:hypothetical protein